MKCDVPSAALATDGSHQGSLLYWRGGVTAILAHITPSVQYAVRWTAYWCGRFSVTCFVIVLVLCDEGLPSEAHSGELERSPADLYPSDVLASVTVSTYQPITLSWNS